MPKTIEPDFLTVKQVAARTQLTIGTVYDAVAKGDLVAHRIGRSIRITPDAYRRWTRQTPRL